ncbi:MAG: hypothetical protein LBD21_10680 [Tannerellaceae bacterium]|jgi:hypothetical protein|nr:hypothetical protein [Tannerellaceae bacterium]
METEFDIEAYYEQVNNLISTPQDTWVENCKSVMTLIVMRCLFEKATERAAAEIKLFCGKLSIFRTDFLKHLENDTNYSQEHKERVITSFQRAVEAFLERGHRLNAIIETPAEWKKEEAQGDGYFAKLFAKYPSQIELKTPRNNFNKLLGATHFSIAPTIDDKQGAVRWEVDESRYRAQVSSSQILYSSYNELFETLKLYSVPIYNQRLCSVGKSC